MVAFSEKMHLFGFGCGTPPKFRLGTDWTFTLVGELYVTSMRRSSLIHATFRLLRLNSKQNRKRVPESTLYKAFSNEFRVWFV